MSLHYSDNPNECGDYVTRLRTEPQRESAQQRPRNNIDGPYPDDFLNRTGDSDAEIHVFEDDSDGDDSDGDDPLSASRRELFCREFSRVEDHLTSTRNQRRDATEKDSKLCQEGQEKHAKDKRHTSSHRRSSNSSHDSHHRNHDRDRNRSNGRSRLHDSSPASLSHDCEEKVLFARSQRRDVMELLIPSSAVRKLRQEGHEKQAKDTRHTSSHRRSSNSSHHGHHDRDRNRSNARSRLHNSSPACLSHDCEEKMLTARSQHDEI
jgi:hypothetical protein